MSNWEKISAPDLERLSAYLDGELNPAEAAELEARLRQDAELRQRLRELERTVEAVRLLPAAAAPRDFRLTEPMLAQSRRGILARLEAGLGQLRLYPVLQLGTALAALALVTLAGFDVLVNNSLAGIRLQAPSERAFQVGEDLDQPTFMADEQAQQTAEAEQALRAAEAPAAAPMEQAAGTPETSAPEGEAEEGIAAGAAEAEQAEEELAAAAAEGEADQEAAEDSVEAEPPPQSEAEQETDMAAAPESEAAEPSELQPVSTSGPIEERSAADRLFEAPAARAALTLAELGLAAATLLLLVFTLRERSRA